MTQLQVQVTLIFTSLIDISSTYDEYVYSTVLMMVDTDGWEEEEGSQESMML